MTAPLRARFSSTHLFSTILAFSVAVLFACSITASAQTFTLLHAFSGTTDGATPQASLILDSAGNLYGTTGNGGTASSGIVFKLDPAGNETILYTFSGGTDGQYPVSGLLRDKSGNLYGTTYDGGTGFNLAGTVFKLTPSGKETVLYNFQGQADGGNPESALIVDAAGNLYGSTEGEGAFGFGTIYKLDPSHHETVLYSFHGEKSGSNPSRGSLIRDSAGNFYGTAGLAGYHQNGVVFRVFDGAEVALHVFTGGADGGVPYWSLIRDSEGNLYGTTAGGGTSLSGTVFKMDRSGNETVLYSFSGGADGQFALGGVVRDSEGNLYGTTNSGGAFGFGTVYKLDTAGNESVLYSFTGGSDGANPQASLIFDAGGNLYGTATAGGAGGNGTVFKITP